MRAPEALRLRADRLFGLHRVLRMTGFSLEDATRWLSAMSERSYRRGASLASRGKPPDTAFLILDGELAVSSARAPASTAKAGESAGIVELLAEEPDGLDVRCVVDATVLEIEKADFLRMAAEDFGMMEAIQRAFASTLVRSVPFAQTIHPSTPTWASHPVGYIERMLFLRELSALYDSGIATLAELAEMGEETRLVDGVLVRAGETLDGLYVVAHGTVTHGETRLAAGDTFGWLQSMARQPLACELRTLGDASVLRFPLEAMLELLEEDVPFALASMRRLAQEILTTTASDGHRVLRYAR